MKKLLLVFVCLMFSLLGISQNHWEPNVHQFPTNMNAIAILEINGIEQQSDSLELGVFCDNQCRGSVMLDYYDAPVSRYLFFLTIFGENGDQFTFRLYDHVTEQELDLLSQNSVQYHTNDILGSVSNPYVFSFTGGEYQLNLEADPSTAGTVSGGGNWPAGTYCTVTATPNEGNSFVAWMLQGDTLSTEAEFSFNLVTDITLTSLFFVDETPISYEIVAEVMPSVGGTIHGDGFFEEGSLCSLTIELNEHYEFVNWTENEVEVSTDPNYSFIVDQNRFLVANVVFVNEIEENEGQGLIYPNPTSGALWIASEGTVADSERVVRIMDMNGKLLLATTSDFVDLSGYEDGVYYISVGGGKLQKLVLRH